MQNEKKLLAEEIQSILNRLDKTPSTFIDECILQDLDIETLEHIKEHLLQKLDNSIDKEWLFSLTDNIK